MRQGQQVQLVSIVLYISNYFPTFLRSIHDYSQAHRDSASEDEMWSPEPSVPTTSRRRRATRKSRSRAEDATQGSNYYPIMWRVIGGGVMMGGERGCSFVTVISVVFGAECCG